MTADELTAWRDRYGLKTKELAFVIGMSAGGIRNKLAGRRGISLRMDRQIAALEMLLGVGLKPPGWPERLNGRTHLA